MLISNTMPKFMTVSCVYTYNKDNGGGISHYYSNHNTAAAATNKAKTIIDMR